MKKLFVIILTIVLVVSIYLINLDRKVFFFAIGDSVSLGKVDKAITEKNYNYYIADYFSKISTLEKYVKQYEQEGLRINDVINDINSNKKIMVGDRAYSLKNLLIKADIVTISINHDDLFNKLNNNYNVNELYNWIDEIINDYEDMLSLIRSYCKEKVVVIGYYYPGILEYDSQIFQVISHLNDSFKELSSLYDVSFINPLAIFLENEDAMGLYYPTELGYKLIGEQIISIIKD